MFRKERLDQGFNILTTTEDLLDKLPVLRDCLDSWSTTTSKNKRKKKRENKTINDCEINQESFTADIEKLGKPHFLYILMKSEH